MITHAVASSSESDRIAQLPGLIDALDTVESSYGALAFDTTGATTKDMFTIQEQDEDQIVAPDVKTADISSDLGDCEHWAVSTTSDDTSDGNAIESRSDDPSDGNAIQLAAQMTTQVTTQMTTTQLKAQVTTQVTATRLTTQLTTQVTTQVTTTQLKAEVSDDTSDDNAIDDGTTSTIDDGGSRVEKTAWATMFLRLLVLCR